MYPATHKTLIISGLVVLVYITIRVIWFANVTTRSFNDAVEFRVISGLSPFSKEFFTSWRPFMLPLFWRILLNDYGFIVIGQLVLSLFSWILFAATLSWISPPRVRVPVLLFVLITSLSWPIVFWDRVLMTESLAISLMVITVTAAIAAIKTRNPFAYVTFVISAIIWTLTRDINAVVVLAGAVPFAIVANRRLAFGLIGAAVICAAALTGLALSQIGDRGRDSLFNVVTYRIVNDEAMMTSLTKRGLPVDELELAMSENVHDVVRNEAKDDPRFDKLRDWLGSEGPRDYISALISDPGYAILEPLPDISKAVYPSVNGFAPVDGDPIIGSESGWVPPPVAFLAMIVSVGVFVLAMILTIRAKAHGYYRYWWLLGGGTVLALIHYYGIWLTDALALERHSVQLAAQIQMTWTILLIVGIRLIHQNRQQPSAD